MHTDSAHQGGDNGQTLIDAMAQPAAILGPDGRLLAINRAWQQLGEDSELAAFNLGTGSARTSGCECRQQDSCELSEAASEGIVEVLYSGRRTSCRTAMCEASGVPRWFRIDVGALPLADSRGALVVCTEVTEYKQPLPAATQARLFA